MPARLRTLTLVLGLTPMALPSGFAQAQTTVTTTTTSTIARASHADVEALMALEDWPGKLAGLRETFASQMRLAVNSPRWSDLSPQARDELGRQLAEVMARHFAWPGPLQSLVQETYLTQVAAEDVATLLAFYRSADGQWLVKRPASRRDGRCRRTAGPGPSDPHLAGQRSACGGIGDHTTGTVAGHHQP